MGGGLAAYGLQKTVLSEAPSILRSEDGGFFLKSQRGNVVRIFSDKMGRLWFLDQGGNFYYDTDIPGAGFYCYTREGRIYNLYEDRDGNPQASFVGSVEDLVTIESRELGYITAFEDGRRIYLPPDARTAQIDPDTGGVRFTPPPLLEVRGGVWEGVRTCRCPSAGSCVLCEEGILGRLRGAWVTRMPVRASTAGPSRGS